MQHPFVRPRTTIDLRAPGGLAALFASTRAEFCGHTMTATAPEATPGAPAGGAPDPAAGQPAPAGTPAAGQASGQAADLEPRDGEDAAALLARVGADGVAQIALRARREAGDRRVELRTAQQTAEQQATDAAAAERQKLLDQLKPGLVALGVLKDDETPDPQKLAGDLQTAKQQATEQQTAAQTARLELAVFRAAAADDVDADRLLDSRRFADTIATLDPTSADFGSKIKAAIEDAVKKDGSLKLTRAVGRAGMPHVGGSGGQAGTARTPKSLTDAVNDAYNPTR